jgi:hypothetical protein
MTHHLKSDSTVRNRQADNRLTTIILICGLIASSAVVLADEPEVPDMAFLEYLGSWQESDEDWMLFADDELEAETPEHDEEGNGTEPARKDEEVAEVDDEN